MRQEGSGKTPELGKTARFLSGGKASSEAKVGLREVWLRWNGASNRLYYRLTRRPHHFDRYKRLVQEAAARSTDIVHLGAGSVWLGDLCNVDLEGKTVYAVEPDAEALALNPTPLKLVAGGEKIPLPSASVDAIVCEYVVEHLEHPEEVLQEAQRLLRPGGCFVFVTPNLLSYSGLVTHLTPQWLHLRFLRALLRVGGSANERPYPTAFRMNTLWAVHRLARQTGFEVRALYTGVDHPTYTYPFPGIHQLAVLWHVLLDKIEWLAPFRITLIGVLEKPAEPSPVPDVG
jgi:SAM-dependent methyltransferase